MRLSKTLTLGAAVLAGGLISLSSATQAITPTGGPIASVHVDGSGTAGIAGFTGVFKGGTYSFAGGTFGCHGGSIAGTIQRGSGSTRGNMAFNTLSFTCATPIGGNSTFSVQAAGCATSTFLPGANVHDGLVDTGTGAKFHRIPGTLSMPAQSPVCFRYSSLGGICTAQVVGSVSVYLDETQEPGTLAQDLALNGSGLSFTGQSGGCLGLMSGAITFNNFTFNVSTTSPTVAIGGIDFRQTTP